MEVKTQVVNALAENKKTALLVLGGVGAAAAILAFKYLRKPEELVRVGVVSQLLVHPLKSGKAVSVALAECHKFGLRFGELQDRHWLVVKEDGQMVTGRQQPRLVLVSLTCEGGHVCLNGPNMEELKFPVKQPDNHVMDCRVFGDDIQGRDCGDEASRWLTRYLGEEKTFRLVHFEPQMKARQSPEPLFPRDEKVAYLDVGPVMLLSEASVQNLSSKLEKDVTVSRFRPNIVISDCEAFAEDSWAEIQIGNVRLQRVMSCGRCIFTTVDPETGIINRKEPLETLKSYRLCDPSEKDIYKASPLFGQLHTVKKTGILQVGDIVYKISR
ncbi:mitochondrial amidoxime-reducing component 1-like [Solea senegalensis]|uniref:Mitochondrial amidoxime-reducing component 1-like n=1 Tax=Solea senegalensis TaxID=28829 RepID=A0AAV6S265_SOLSE|nr:mitochondrial amidoxime-reducing component 1-like [Solea senegalensis]KAG7511159.1 mitochondrial amidoxime-reducing component 1-like [Solea senegalensis]